MLTILYIGVQKKGRLGNNSREIGAQIPYENTKFFFFDLTLSMLVNLSLPFCLSPLPTNFFFLPQFFF